MTHFSLREAAERAGTSKSTIWRSIKSGRLSAARTDDGGFAIDPAELFRVFPSERFTPHFKGQDATPTAGVPEQLATAETATETRGTDSELRVALARAEVELAGVKALLAEVKANRDELRVDRDGWRERAERLLAPPPSRPWWRRLAG